MATAYATIGGLGINPNVSWTAASTDGYDNPPHKLGTVAEGNDGSRWVYVKASSAITGEGYAVQLTSTWTAAHVTTSNSTFGSPIAVAKCAIASGSYGWVQTGGLCNIYVLASCAANAKLNTTATAGAPDDDATTGAKVIDGMILTSARAASAGLAAGFLRNPVIAATL